MSKVMETRLEELKRIEDELIKAAEGSSATEDSKESNPTQGTGENLLEPSGSESKVSTGEVAEQNPEGEGQEPSWKEKALDAQYRFGKYKAKTDATIYSLRVENKELREKIVEYAEKVETLTATANTQKVEDVFSQEVVDVLGEEAVNAIKKVISQTNEKVEATEKKLRESEKKRTVEKIQEDVNESYETFVSALQDLVPDCLALNTNPEFLEWLDQPDVTGIQRLKRLQAAQKIGDVERVADFFNKFKETKAVPKKPERKDSISNRIGPTQKGSSTEIPKESNDTISIAFIKTFESDVSKGRYKGRESEKKAMDKRIEQAYLEGRIVP